MNSPQTASWKDLNHLQLGRYAEHMVKMELIRAGLSVFACEVDDRGIDLVVRIDEQHYVDIQVKSVRRDRTAYVFMPKHTFAPRENLILALVPFIEGQWPTVYLIPAIRWRWPDDCFKSRDYEGRESKPEWGMDMTAERLARLHDLACPDAARHLKEWLLPALASPIAPSAPAHDPNLVCLLDEVEGSLLASSPDGRHPRHTSASLEAMRMERRALRRQLGAEFLAWKLRADRFCPSWETERHYLRITGPDELPAL